MQERVLERREEDEHEAKGDRREQARQHEGLGDKPDGLAPSREELEGVRQAQLKQDSRREGQEDDEVVVALTSRAQKPGEEDAVDDADGCPEDLGAEHDGHSAGERACAVRILHRHPTPLTDGC